MDRDMTLGIRTAICVLLMCAVGIATASADDQQRGRARSTAPASESSGWDLALTGGFVATGLIDPVFALGNVTGQATRVVLREPEQESSVNIGVAMFAQIYHDRASWVAPLSFGIGVRSDSRATFYLGSAV